MKLIRTKLEKLQNAAWYIYLTFVIKLISQKESIKTLFAPQLALLEKVHADAGVALEFIRKNQWSKEVDDADTLRDRYWGGLKNFLRAFQYDPDAATQHAAERLMSIVEHYGDVANAPQDQESGLIIDSIKELNNYPEDIETLNLGKRIEQLQEANERFMEVVDRRTLEIGNRTPLRMVDIRRDGDKIIRLIYAQLEVWLQSEPSADITQFASELTAENVRVNGGMRK
jgi:hypothetical protein